MCVLLMGLVNFYVIIVFLFVCTYLFWPLSQSLSLSTHIDLLLWKRLHRVVLSTTFVITSDKELAFLAFL